MLALSRTLCEDSFIDSVLERHTYLLQGARRKGTVSLEVLAVSGLKQQGVQ